MANTSFGLCSAPSGGRYAKIYELGGSEKARGEGGYSKYMPIRSHEVLSQMQELHDVGVRSFHQHSFDECGIHACDPKFYTEISRGLREIDPQAMLSFASSLRRGQLYRIYDQIARNFSTMGVNSYKQIDPQNPEHLGVFVDAHLTRFEGSSVYPPPDTLTTITAFEYAVLSNPKNMPHERQISRMMSGKDERVIKGYYEKHVEILKQNNVHHEIEVSTTHSFRAIKDHFEDPKNPEKIGNPVHFVILFGFSKELALNDENVQFALEEIENFKQRNPNHQVSTTFGAVIRPKQAAAKRTDGLKTSIEGGLDYEDLVRLTLKHDHNNLVTTFRFGNEDTPAMYGEQVSDVDLAKDLAERIFPKYGITVEKDALALRKRHNLPERNPIVDMVLAQQTRVPESVNVLDTVMRLRAIGFDPAGLEKISNTAKRIHDALDFSGGLCYLKDQSPDDWLGEVLKKGHKQELIQEFNDNKWRFNPRVTEAKESFAEREEVRKRLTDDIEKI